MVLGLLMGAPVCSLLLGSSPPSVDARIAMYPLHDPIVISDDSEFTSENGVVSGSGNESDPYIIENWEIALDAASEASAGILISGTESHFVVRDAYIHGELYSGDGIRLEDVLNGSVEYCIVNGIEEGICLSGSSASTIMGNDLTDSRLAVSSSHDVSISSNLIMKDGIWISGCSWVTVTNNVVFRGYMGSWGGIGVELDSCDRCEVSDNTISTDPVMAGFGHGLMLRQSTNCSLEGNAFIDKGIDLSGTSVEHYASHVIGGSNTVQGLPVRYYKNESVLSLPHDDFGQVIVVNTSDLRVRDIVVQDNWMPFLFAFIDGGRMEDCILRNSSEAITLVHSKDFVIEDNTFAEDASVDISSCSDVSFSYNTYVEGTRGCLSVSADWARIEYNRFPSSGEEVQLYYSTNATITGNVFPKRGLWIEGRSQAAFASHEVSQDNFVGPGLLYYFSGVSGMEIDASAASQVILVDCSHVSLHSMEAHATRGLQLHYVDNITVSSCSFADFMTAVSVDCSEAVTIRECDFGDGGSLIHIRMSYDLRVYHNNFMGLTSGLSCSGFGDYTVEGKVQWDDGYPSGGNYWAGHLGYDNHSGASQDVPGADGIVDTPVSWIEFGVDRYPLTEPFGLEPSDSDRQLFVFDSSVIWWLAVAAVVLSSAAIAGLLYARGKPREPPEGPSDGGHQEGPPSVEHDDPSSESAGKGN